jgi:glycosyltransferase involved in cell wall biosynthesis
VTPNSTAEPQVTTPLKVLYCIDAMGPGGTEKQLAALIQHLDPRVVRPFLCTLRPSLTHLGALGCEVLELPFASFGSPSVVGCVGRMRRFMRERSIDLVHAFFQDATILAYLATLGTHVVRIVSFRDMGFWRTPWKIRQLRYVYPRYHGFVANSRAVAQYVNELDGIPLEKITVIYNGVHVPAERLDGRRGENPVVGIVSNLNREVKRVDLFLQAARLIADAFPQIRFVIVGDGHLRPALSDLCSALGLTDLVSFRGRVADPSGEIARFDIGVLTSDSEGLPNSILEYMAAGIPTVARRVGGNPEVTADGETGLLVDGDDAPAIAHAVLRLLSDPELRERMGRRARAVAVSGFSLGAYAQQHEACYTRVVHTRRAFTWPDTPTVRR